VLCRLLQQRVYNGRGLQTSPQLAQPFVDRPSIHAAGVAFNTSSSITIPRAGPHLLLNLNTPSLNQTTMKMILFRPTFVTAGTTLQVLALLCIFLSITSGASSRSISRLSSSCPDASMVFVVSAAPQFGRPQVHVLDEQPVPSQNVEPLVGGDPTATSSVPDAVPSVKPTSAAGDQADVRIACCHVHRERREHSRLTLLLLFRHRRSPPLKAAAHHTVWVVASMLRSS
jgi:hypothetical protein